MEMIKRSHERVAQIDRYIKEKYPDEGPDKVASALGEPRSYVQERAWYLKVKMKSRKKNKSSTKPKKPQQIKKIEEERDMWRRKYHAERIRTRRYYNQLQEAL